MMTMHHLFTKIHNNYQTAVAGGHVGLPHAAMEMPGILVYGAFTELADAPMIDLVDDLNDALSPYDNRRQGKHFLDMAFNDDITHLRDWVVDADRKFSFTETQLHGVCDSGEVLFPIGFYAIVDPDAIAAARAVLLQHKVPVWNAATL